MRPNFQYVDKVLAVKLSERKRKKKDEYRKLVIEILVVLNANLRYTVKELYKMRVQSVFDGF